MIISNLVLHDSLLLFFKFLLAQLRCREYKQTLWENLEQYRKKGIFNVLYVQ